MCPTPRVECLRHSLLVGGVAQGLSNKLIARALEISEGTVKTHVKNLLEKLDASSRTEALAGRRGLITL